MTDSQSEVIQWWAEKVGWKWNPVPDSVKEFALGLTGYWTHGDSDIAWEPERRRAHLQALAGLAEDWLREQLKPGQWLNYEIAALVDDRHHCYITVGGFDDDTSFEAKHTDPTIAKLLAFKALAEKLDG